MAHANKTTASSSTTASGSLPGTKPAPSIAADTADTPSAEFSVEASVLALLGGAAPLDQGESTTPSTATDQPAAEAGAETPDAPAEAEPATEAPEADDNQEPAGDEPAGEAEPKEEAPKVSPKLQARIDELTSRAKGAEEQLTAAATRLQESDAALTRLQQQLMASQAAREDKYGLTAANNPQELHAKASALASEVEKYEEYLDKGEEPDNNGDPQAITPERAQMLKGFIRDARKSVQQLVPLRQQQLQQAAGFNSRAATEFPWLSQAADPRTKHVVETLRSFPEIARSPAGLYVAAIVAKHLTEKAAAPATGSAKGAPPVRKAAPVAPSSASRAPAAAPARQPMRRSSEPLNERDLVARIAASL